MAVNNHFFKALSHCQYLRHAAMHKNGDRADFGDKNLAAYLDRFKKRIKSPDMSETFLQVVIGAEDAEDYAQYMLDHF